MSTVAIDTKTLKGPMIVATYAASGSLQNASSVRSTHLGSTDSRTVAATDPEPDRIHDQAHSNRVRVFELFQPLAHRTFGNFQPPRDFPIAQATVVAQQVA